MKIFKRVLVGILVVVLIGTIGLVVWGNDAYPPLQPALDALQSDAQVTVTQHDGFITYEPVGVTPTTGFVFGFLRCAGVSWYIRLIAVTRISAKTLTPRDFCILK